MSNRPPDSVLRAFGLSSEVRPLDGGEGRTWRAGDVVLKPCDDAAGWAWQAEVLTTVEPRGFRLPRPVAASDGAWIVDGWCAQEAVAGAHPDPPRWLDVLAVAERFERALRPLARPAFLDGVDSPWALGDRVAWGEVDPPDGAPLVRRVLDLRRPIDRPSQLVHGDLTENVLFADGRPPAVIDVSPYWRPAGFGAAVVVADAVCWRGADPNTLLPGVAEVPEFPQLLVRALAYRMTTAAVRSGPRLELFRPGIDLVERLVRRTW